MALLHHEKPILSRLLKYWIHLIRAKLDKREGCDAFWTKRVAPRFNIELGSPELSIDGIAVIDEFYAPEQERSGEKLKEGFHIRSYFNFT